MRAPQRAHDAAGHGFAHAKRIAHRQHGVADLQGIGVAQGDGLQPLAGHFQHGQVGFGVGPDDGCLHHRAIVEHHFDVISAFNDVVVGQQVSGRADDNARPQAGLRLGVALLAKEEPEPRV